MDNPFLAVDGRPFDFTIQSDGACASGVAQGFPDSWVLEPGPGPGDG